MPKPRLFSVWRNLVHRDRLDRDLDDELRTMFDLAFDEKIASGMSLEDARRAVTLEMGRLEVVKEQVREVRAGAFADTAFKDLRYGARLLRRNPSFAVTAALSLAIGIAANTTIFTIANALLFRAPGGVSEPEGLVDLSRAEEGKAFPSNFTTSYPYYRDIRQRATTLAGAYAHEFEPRPVTVMFGDGTEYAFANLVSINYFAVLGVVPASGRLFTAADSEDAGASPIVVLSHRFWKERLNADPAVIGRQVRMNRQPFTVVGVAGEAFRGTTVISPDLWLPMGMVGVVEPGTSRLTNRRPDGVGMGGRLKPGISIAQAAAELDVIARELERENPLDDRGTRLRVAALSSVPAGMAGVAAGFLALLLGLVSVVLVIASANVAGVLLARAVARRREIAVRMAIGAGRARVIRQLLTETMLLFLLGSAVALVVARWMIRLLLSVLPAFPIPVEVSLPLDGRVMVFATGLTLVAALLSGLAPALHASKADVVSGLKDQSQRPSAGRLRARSTFVVAQVAFSILLVIVAGLLVKALRRVSTIDLGFDPRGVEAASLDLSSAGYLPATGALFARDLVERTRTLPGVVAATLSEFMPGRGGRDVRVTVPGTSPADGEPYFTCTFSAVDSEYFTTLRIPLVAGRGFSAADRADTQSVVILGETAARDFWPGQDPVGKVITWHVPRPGREDALTRLQVIGVARDLRPPGGAAAGGTRRIVTRVREDGGPQIIAVQPSTLMMYVPLAQRYTPRFTLLARSRDDRRLASEIRNLVRSMDPNLPMLAPQPLDSAVGPVYLQLRIAASVAGSVGLVGLLLAGIGIYGVTAYTTVQRTREIGIRMALGAQGRDVIGMVLGQGLSLVCIGSVIGLLLAAGASRLFTRLMFGMPTLDPAVFVGSALLFAATGLAACYLPARRATRVDAMEALRYE